jgi:hypothetical protein
MPQQLVKFTSIQGCKREHGSLKCSNSNYKNYLQKKAAVRLYNEPTTRFGLKLQGYKRTRVKYPEEASYRLLSIPILPCEDGAWKQRAALGHTCCDLWQKVHMAMNTVHSSRPLHYIRTSPVPSPLRHHGAYITSMLLSTILLRYLYLCFTLWLPVLPHTNIA